MIPKVYPAVCETDLARERDYLGRSIANHLTFLNTNGGKTCLSPPPTLERPEAESPCLQRYRRQAAARALCQASSDSHVTLKLRANEINTFCYICRSLAFHVSFLTFQSLTSMRQQHSCCVFQRRLQRPAEQIAAEQAARRPQHHYYSNPPRR